MFKCVYGSHCLHPQKVCNGHKDCMDDTYHGEDEVACAIEHCHPGCYCNGYALSCISTNLTSIPTSNRKILAVLFPGNYVYLHVSTFLFGQSLLLLDMSKNKISMIPPNIFRNLILLISLDISQNVIRQN